MGRTRGGSSSSSGGTNLGTAYASVKVDYSQVSSGLNAALNAIRGGVASVGHALDSIGQKTSAIGGALTQTFTPAAGAFGLAAKGAMDFEESLTNIQSVTFKTTEEMATMRSEILGLAEDSRYGPQELAASMYDIAGGVTDATTHMAILEASIKTATAGNASLAGTTSGLISVMNAYDLTAADAAKVSDVLVRTVGMGVGTMDQFTSALGPASGLAYDLGISFEELAASTAFLTSTGSSPSEAVTQLTGVMSAFLKPNAHMTKALKLMGYESGTAAIKALGLQGAVHELSGALGGSTDEMAKALGQQEALGGAIGLLSDRSKEFTDDFMEGMEGAAAAAEEIQLTSTAAQFDILKSNIEVLVVEIGSALLPVINDLIKQIKPVIKQIVGWVRENPELVKTIGMIVVALGTLGPILAVVGAAISGIGALIGALSSPIVLIVGALGALYYAFQENVGGIRDIVQPVLDFVGRLFEAVTRTISFFIDDVQQFGLGEAFASIFGKGEIIDNMESTLEGALTIIGVARDDAIKIVDGLWKGLQGFGKAIEKVFKVVIGFIQRAVLPTLQRFGEMAIQVFNTVGPIIADAFNALIYNILPALVNIIETAILPAFMSVANIIVNNVLPVLASLASWFINDALPAVIQFITGVVVPAFNTFVGILMDIWNMVGPPLTQLANWFITEALPAVVGFIQGTVIPAMQQLVGFIQKLWTDVQPFLQQMFDWFVTSALPAVVNFIETIVVPVIQKFIDILTGIWETVGPVLQSLYDWFITNGLPAIVEFFNNVVTPMFNDFIDTLSSIWTVVSPFIDLLVTGLQTAFNVIKDVVITPLIGVIDGLLKILQGIWESVQGPVNAFKDNLRIVFDGIRGFIDSIITRVGELIQTLKDVGEFMGNLDQTGKGAGGLFGSGFGPDFDPLGGIRNIGRDQGGRGYPGNVYAIGTGAQPEVFIPDSAGSFYPRDQWMGQGGMGGSTDNSVNVEAVYIQANSYAEGQAAADGFDARMKEIRRSRG